jgi:hypothetical protein
VSGEGQGDSCNMLARDGILNRLEVWRHSKHAFEASMLKVRYSVLKALLQLQVSYLYLYIHICSFCHSVAM